jgi:uncharacterized protein DUF6152
MTCRLMVSSLAVAAALAVSPGMPAQTAVQPGAAEGAAIPRKADGRPDLTGVWDRPGAARQGAAYSGTRGPGAPSRSMTSEEPSLTPWATQIFQRNRKGITTPYENGRIELDPDQWCFPPGPSRLITNNRPFEIRQQPNRIILLFEQDHWVRRIWTDGRAQPEGYPTTFMGYSVGKWEGDTLVSETVAIDSRTWVNALGRPQSDEMRMVERFRRVNQNTLEVVTTFDDPKAYAKPWTEKNTFELMPPGYEIMEHVACGEWLEVGKLRRPERLPVDLGKFYNRDHPITLTGIVLKFDFSNPYVQIHFGVKDKTGVASNWIAETAPPQQLYRAGWNTNSLQPGDTMTVTGFPAREGQKKMAVQRLSKSDGRILSAGAE